MKLHALTRCTLLAAATLCLPAAAYDSENAVPLTLGLEAGKVTVEKIAVKLNGREVTVSTTLRNGEAAARRIGWYASTPQFAVLGDGEEHLDKSFADIGARFNGQARKPAAYRRGYFMGRDITAELAKAGLSPLPDLQADQKKLDRLAAVQGMRPEQWQGYAAYSWTEAVPAQSSALVEVQYRALPQFALADLDSAVFAQTVQQHCGNPDAVRRRILAVDSGATQVMIERYDLPLAFLLQQDVQLEIVQPAANWQHAHPLATLVCGLANAGQSANVSGTVNNASLGLSVLVVSALPDVAVTEAQRHGR